MTRMKKTMEPEKNGWRLTEKTGAKRMHKTKPRAGGSVPLPPVPWFLALPHRLAPTL